jgi:hypothetical protein
MADGGLLPGPFAEPGGPRVDDAAVVRAFAAGEPAGHSDRFRVEDRSLVMAPSDTAAAIRLNPGTVLVQHYLPSDLEAAKGTLEQSLVDAGLTMFDEETLLGTAVAMQLVGLREPTWDLWGTDIDTAFFVLRKAAAGGADEPMPPIG